MDFLSPPHSMSDPNSNNRHLPLSSKSAVGILGIVPPCVWAAISFARMHRAWKRVSQTPPVISAGEIQKISSSGATLTLDGTEYTRERRLGSGTFGHVYSFRSKNVDCRGLAIKVMTRRDAESRDEYRVVEAAWPLMRDWSTSLVHHLVSAVSISHLKTIVTVMPEMEGTLLQLIGCMTDQTILRMTDQISLGVAALDRLGMVFTDIKAANVLYVTADRDVPPEHSLDVHVPGFAPSSVCVFLGDYGSATPPRRVRKKRSRAGSAIPGHAERLIGVSTYPPFRAPDGLVSDPTNADAMHSLGVLALSMACGVGAVDPFSANSMTTRGVRGDDLRDLVVADFSSYLRTRKKGVSNAIIDRVTQLTDIADLGIRGPPTPDVAARSHRLEK